MKPMDSKKMMASAVVFLFTSFSLPPLEAVTPSPIAPQKERVAALKTPHIDPGVPRVVNMTPGGLFSSGNTIAIRSIDYAPTLIDDLKQCSFVFASDGVSVVNRQYGETGIGYVNLMPSSMKTGLLQIVHPKNNLEMHLQNLLRNPTQYKVHLDLVNAQITPKIIADGETHLLAMEPWDFSLVAHPHYNQRVIDQMFANSYATMKAYVQIMQTQHPGAQVVVHTGYWGIQQQNNPRVTTAIQLIAAQLAGVDQLVFHMDDTSALSVQVFFDSQLFVQSQSGNPMSNVLQNVLKQTAQTGWQAGTMNIASTSWSSVGPITTVQ